ncbi:hypothetical protein KEM54_006371 [Ascosphaera aggregata]|nr:hypothetical protein KEM54_006371 [Ascosphaera aggregata]
MVSLKSFLTASALATATFAAPLQAREPSGKRGLAFNYQTKLGLFNNHGLTWSYNWNPTTDGEHAVGEYVPMLSAKKDVDIWRSALAGLGKVNHILGFNEPDHASQANMSPEQAVAYYRQYISPYHGQASLGSPAITSANEPGKGLDWMASFLKQCDGECNIDFLATHWYANEGSGEQNAEDFLRYVDQAVALAHSYGISKIWITEFGFGYNSGVPRSERATFLRRVLPALDANESVERYAYFFDLNLDGGSDTLGEEAQTYMA